MLYDQVGHKITYDASSVVNLYPALLLDVQHGATQLDGKSVLVDLLQKPYAKRIADLMCTTNDCLGNPVEIGSPGFDNHL